MMYKGKPIKVGWVEDTFAEDVKDNILYGDAYEITHALANGDDLQAEVICEGDHQLLSIRYLHKGWINVAEVLLKWFPEDDDLLETIHKVYRKGRG